MRGGRGVDFFAARGAGRGYFFLNVPLGTLRKAVFPGSAKPDRGLTATQTPTQAKQSEKTSIDRRSPAKNAGKKGVGVVLPLTKPAASG